MVKKIVFVGFFSGFGGAEKAMITVANGLVKLGNDVTLISLKDNNVVYEIDKQVKYTFIPDTNGFKICKQLNRLLKLKRQLKIIKPDIVISFWLQPAIFAAILSKFIGFKTIYSERGDPTDKEYDGFLGVLRGLFLRGINGFVFQTYSAKECFPKVIQKRSTVIHNPVFIKSDDYSTPNERRKVIVNVGRLHEQKNQSLLIDAFARISNQFPEYIVEIYGEGHLKNKLENKIEKLGLKDRVFLKGTTKKLHYEIYDVSLFVLTSDYEGMPNALLEAMALGLPCISTNYKPNEAVKEFINNNENGLIIECNSIDSLAHATEYMLRNLDKAVEMGANARQINNLHSPKKIYQLWNDYIYEICGDRN